jgi:hypothetical protein
MLVVSAVPMTATGAKGESCADACGHWRLMILLLEGCGGSNPARFINQTRHSDAELWALWKAAQQNLAQQIDLNPLQRTLANVPPQIFPGDPRVWKAWPRQLTVSSRLDVSSTALFTATGMSRA